ncbi:hypothetical protein [Nostoc sp.]
MFSTSVQKSTSGAERNPTYIRMLGYAKPPTPLATTRETRATQWLPNRQFFCNIKAMTVHNKTTEIFSEIKYDSYITNEVSNQLEKINYDGVTSLVSSGDEIFEELREELMFLATNILQQIGFEQNARSATRTERKLYEQA